MALFDNNPILAKWFSEGLSAHEENVESFSEDPMNVKLIGSTAHSGLMAVTPKRYEDDVNAFLYYGSYGLLDPKNPTVDAPATKAATGWGYGKSLSVTLVGGFVTWGAVGWVLDPHGRREGGADETTWFGPGKWYAPQG
jgi:hypothetical protein